jgi:hypothetical protein
VRAEFMKTDDSIEVQRLSELRPHERAGRRYENTYATTTTTNGSHKFTKRAKRVADKYDPNIFVPYARRQDTSAILPTSVQQVITLSEGEMINNTKIAINKKGLAIKINHLSSKVSPAITVESKDTSNVTVARKSEIKKMETLITSEQNKPTSHILKK